MTYHGRAQLFRWWGFDDRPQLLMSALLGLREAMKRSQDEASLIRCLHSD